MDLVHLEHPSQRTPKPCASATAIRPPGGSLSDRRVDHFPSGASTVTRPVVLVAARLHPATSGCAGVRPQGRAFGERNQSAFADARQETRAFRRTSEWEGQ